MAEHRARKRFGQNFLVDGSIISRIVSYLNPRTDDRVVEIGPGQGALTRPLMERLNVLHAVELDRDLIHILEALPLAREKLALHQGDALAFNYCELAGEKNLRLIGNLPYNISSPLLFHFIEQLHCIDDMLFMLQKEMAERIIAGPGEKNRGRLGIMIQLFCETEMALYVPPESFMPAPKVDSAVIYLKARKHPLITPEEMPAMSNMLAQAFSKRRKTLRNSIGKLIGTEAIQAAGVDDAMRPEALDLAEWAALLKASRASKQ